MVQAVSWKTVWGNRYLQRLDRSMLAGEGCKVRKVTRTIGTASKDDPDVYDVVYDVDYVREKLTKTVLEPLGIQTKEELLSLINQIL